MKKKKNKPSPKVSPGQKWKKRPSELKGFDTACYRNHESGDYLRVDYSGTDNRIRMYVEIKGQSSDSYYLEIESGEISARSSSIDCRPADVDLVFRQRIKFFYTIPLLKALKEIRKVFKSEVLPVKELPKPAAEPEEKFSLNKLLVKYSLADYFDFTVGIILTFSAYYFFGNNHTLSGIISAIFGVGTGAVDILIRHRKPLFSKILLFLFAGMILYVYGLIY